MMRSSLRSSAWLIALTACVAGGLPSLARAQAQPKTDSGVQSDAQSGSKTDRKLTDPEVRKRIRDMLAKRLDSRRRELDSLDKALKLFDEGKSYEDIRAILPDLPHPGMRGEGRDQWIRRWEDGASGAPGEAVGNGPGAGGHATEPARPLTSDERQAVRDILKETAPKLLDRLQELEKSKPEEAEKQYSEAFRRSRGLLDTRKRDPEMFDLRLREIRHGRQALEASAAIAKLEAPPEAGTAPLAADQKDAERKKRIDQLREALRAQYEVRTQIMQKEALARPGQQSEAVEKSVKDMIERAKRPRGNRPPDGDHGGPSGNRRPGEDGGPGPRSQQ